MPETASRLPEEDRAKTRPGGSRGRKDAGTSSAGGASTRATGGAGSQSGGSTSSAGQLGQSGSSGTTSTDGASLYHPNELKNAEESPEQDDGQVGQGYNPSPNTGMRSRLAQRLKGKVTKKRAAIGAGIAGAGVGGAALVFLALIPLKIENIVSNLESHFFGTSENAIGDETNNMLENYIVTSVLPSYKRCGTTIDKSCTARVIGSNPVDNLYRTWANAKLENKLATDYGIEFRYNSNNTWSLKAPGTDAGGDNIGTDGNKLDSEFNRADRQEMRQAIKDAMQGETLWKKVMFRYQVGRLLEEKYGIKRCIIFCGTKDALADKVADRKIAAKLYLTQRVISPYTQTLGIAMECLFDPSCDPGNTQPQTAEDGKTGETAGAPASEFDTQVQANLVQIGENYGSTATPQELEDAYNKLKDKGYQSAILDEILGKVGLNDLGSQVLDKAAMIGWVNTAANTIVAVQGAGPKLVKLSYVAKSSAFIGAYMMSRTFADEIHTGNVNATEVGSMVDMFGPGTSSGPDDPITGGPASAENTTVYQNLINKEPIPGGTNTKGEICNDGKPVPAGQAICPEDKEGGGNAYVSSVSNSLNAPPLSYITSIAHAWKNTVGGIFSFAGNIFGSILSSIPGVSSVISDVTSFVAQAGQPFIQFLTNNLIPNDFGGNQGGARNIVQVAGGADAAGGDFASSIGAQQVTPAQYATVLNQQQAEAKQSFANQSFFARMFSTSSQYSLVSKIAMDIPLGTHAMAQSGFANLLNPFGALSHSFASVFSGKVNADNPAQPDMFGVTQKAFLSVPEDASRYWDENCSDNASFAYEKDNSWNKAAASGPVDPENGMPVNTTANDCLLIKKAVGDGGGAMDTSNLTQDDLADITQSTGTAPTGGTGTYQNPFRDITGFTVTRVDEGVDYYGTGPVYAIGDGVVNEVANGTGSLWWSAFGGDSVVYKLTDGPAAGKSVYVAEHCPPKPGIHVGSQVTSSTPLCDMQPASIETGWALGDGTDQPSAGSVYTESNATAYGQNFEELMESLNVKKACYDHPGQQLQGTLANNWPTWVNTPATKAGPNSCG